MQVGPGLRAAGMTAVVATVCAMSGVMFGLSAENYRNPSRSVYGPTNTTGVVCGVLGLGSAAGGLVGAWSMGTPAPGISGGPGWRAAALGAALLGAGAGFVLGDMMGRAETAANRGG